jgi:hypothetical protein
LACLLRLVLTLIFLEGSPRAYLGKLPEWTLTGACLENGNDSCPEWTIDQRPFHWADGVWEAELLATPHEESRSTDARRIVMRITPDTMRRWKEVGINPFLEACAQLKDHLRSKASPGEMTLLTLL